MTVLIVLAATGCERNQATDSVEAGPVTNPQVRSGD